MLMAIESHECSFRVPPSMGFNGLLRCALSAKAPACYPSPEKCFVFMMAPNRLSGLKYVVFGIIYGFYINNCR